MTRLACLVFVGSALVGAPIVGCLPAPGTLPDPLNVADKLQAQYLAIGLPTTSAIAATDEGLVYFTEKDTGRIRVIKDGVLQDAPFATVPVNRYAERGALGLALHPRFQFNRRVYLFYTRSDTGQISELPEAVIDNRVVYFIADSSGRVATGGEFFVASLPVGNSGVRIGGQLTFAADGTLLVGLGDMTSADMAQDPNSLYGKVLRYDEDGRIPDDNMIPGSPVFAIGFRDPVGLDLDPASDVPFLVEAASSSVYEIDRVFVGRNYGWPYVVGVADTPEELAFAATHPEYLNPILDSAGAPVALTGATFNPSSKYGASELLSFYYADSASQSVVRLELTDARSAVKELAQFARNFPSSMTDVAFTPAGTLYVATTDSVFRINPLFFPPPP